MLKILDTQQLREWDAVTIQNGSLKSIDLMEKACQAFVKWFAGRFQTYQRVGIVCGTGNNGGDGLGIARILNEWGYFVKVWIVSGGMKESEDFSINFQRLPSGVEVKEITSADQVLPDPGEILIDAIFGSGLSREPKGIHAATILAINAAKAIRIAVDVPSGLYADKATADTAVQADFTVTFQTPRLAFLLPENERYVGSWQMVDIGLDSTFIKNAKTNNFYLTRKAVRKILKRRSTFSHKGDYGRALLVGGSLGKIGACILAARATLRAGVGLLTVHIPKCGYSILQSTVPEAMVSVDESENNVAKMDDFSDQDIIGVGPGLGTAKETEAAFRSLLQSGKPMIIDADALNLLAANRELLSCVPPGSILTPHPGEFARLVGKWGNDFERLEKQKDLSKKTQSVIVLKGAHTSISTPDGVVYFNSTGNPGMATGGSGDVLTGILTGLRAQKYTPPDAAILGVYLHGLSGDLAALDLGRNSLIASDLIRYLPKAFLSLER